MKLPEELFFRKRAKLPVFLATERAECGLACLAMIAVYQGHDIDLSYMRQRFSVSMAGSSLRGLMTFASDIGLSTRALRVDIEALERVQLPSILHWDLNHYVVLKSVGKSSAVIHDPSRGALKISKAELSNRFSGVVLELSRAPTFHKLSGKSRFTILSLVAGIRGHHAAITYVVALSIAMQVLSFVLPLQMQLIVDKAINAHSADLLLIIAVSFGALMILNSVTSALRNWTLQLLGSQIVFQIGGNIFHHLIRLSASFFEKRHLGDILLRLGSIRSAQEILTQGALSAVLDGSIAMLAAVALFSYAPELAIIVLLSVLTYSALAVASYPIVRRQTERALEAASTEQSYLMESIRGILAVKLFSGEAMRESTWRNLNGRAFNESVGVARIQQRLKLIEDVVFAIQYIVILYFASRRVIVGTGFTIGMLYAFLAFRAMFTERFLTLVSRGLEFGMLGLFAERIGDLVSESPEVGTAKERVLVSMSGDIVLDNVSFRYGTTDPQVLKGVNLRIQPGEFLAITGPTGGGKTTLLKLLLGLREPTEGRILLNGEIATPEHWQWWRRRMGVVRQDDQLFSGTLADNISFFDPDMDMEKVRNAATAAKVHEDIMSMPAKYLTLVGDMGSILSGGQKQRVLLARALYRGPEVLVLDEGTANLDPVIEELIAGVIATMNITRIVVAHRPALVNRASRVIRVERGEVKVVDRLAPILVTGQDERTRETMR